MIFQIVFLKIAYEQFYEITNKYKGINTNKY